jgi:beta-glucosidase
MPFLFASGIDNSCPTLPNGVRVDQMDRSGHYARWDDDFALARELGVSALRYGPAYYRTHIAPDQYDWETCDEPLRALRALDLTVIADLCRFGVPAWLDGVEDPAFPVLFAEYARAFTRRYPWVRHFTPVSDMFAYAANVAFAGRWNERQADHSAFVRASRNLCMAHELAVEAIVAERPDAIIVQSDTLARFHAAGAGAAREADRWNAFARLPMDLTLGRELAPGLAGLLHEHGVSSNDLSFFRERRAHARRWIGVAYHFGDEVRVAASGRMTTARRGLGFRRLAAECWSRYRLPLFHAGTSRAGRFAPHWLRTQWDDVMTLRASGVPIRGFTWYPLIDRVGAGLAADGKGADGAPAADTVEAVGLADVARRLRPAGRAYRDLVSRWRALMSVPDDESGWGAGEDAASRSLEAR